MTTLKGNQVKIIKKMLVIIFSDSVKYLRGDLGRIINLKIMNVFKDVNLGRVSTCDIGSDIADEESYEQKDVNSACGKLKQADFKEKLAESNLQRFHQLNGVPIEGPRLLNKK